MKRKQEAELATFKFRGDYDEVSAKLEKTLEAQKASFDARLNTQFKPRPPAKPAASPATPVYPRDWAQKAELSSSSRREESDTVRDRLSTTIRTR